MTQTTDNAIERLNREIRRRTRAVGTSPDGALMLVTARLKYVAESEWGSRRYLDVTLLGEYPYRRASLWGCRKVRKILDGTASAARAWEARNEPVSTELELRAANRQVEAVIADALDRAAARK